MDRRWRRQMVRQRDSRDLDAPLHQILRRNRTINPFTLPSRQGVLNMLFVQPGAADRLENLVQILPRRHRIAHMGGGDAEAMPPLVPHEAVAPHANGFWMNLALRGLRGGIGRGIAGRGHGRAGHRRYQPGGGGAAAGAAGAGGDGPGVFQLAALAQAPRIGEGDGPQAQPRALPQFQLHDQLGGGDAPPPAVVMPPGVMNIYGQGRGNALPVRRRPRHRHIFNTGHFWADLLRRRQFAQMVRDQRGRQVAHEQRLEQPSDNQFHNVNEFNANEDSDEDYDEDYDEEPGENEIEPMEVDTEQPGGEPVVPSPAVMQQQNLFVPLDFIRGALWQLHQHVSLIVHQVDTFGPILHTDQSQNGGGDGI